MMDMSRISIHFVNLGLAVAAVGTLSLAYPHVLLARLQPDACVSSTERPNIIFLLTDDHRWDALGYAGNGIIQTPELDKLAANGIYFKNAYVTTSICCVSRASILSGQYASRHQIHDFATEMSDEALQHTYPLLLKQSGYYTGFIGKYGVGEKMPENRFDKWYGFPGQGSYHQQDSLGRGIHLTALMRNQADAFLESTTRDRPFCLSISFKAPHTERGDAFIADSATRYLYALDTLPVPVTAGDSYFEAFPDFFKRNNEARIRWQVLFPTPDQFQENVKKYYRLITEVDQVVGAIREKLAELKLARNTVILFMSDNGFYMGEHGLAGKWYGHEESVRVPLIIYDPRIPARQRGQIRNEIALNIDVAPTILAMAGVAIPREMQGRDLMRLLEQPTPVWRDDFFYEHMFTANDRIPRSEGVIGRRYKYLRYIDFDYEVLYDIESDPHEITNLASQPAYGNLLDTMRDRYGELKQAAK